MAALPPQNRYLWVQFVGLAAVPLLLDVCLAGLASSRAAFGYPSAFGFQYWLMAAVGILPPLAMQCLRPFYIFSVPPLALKPSALTTNQRRCLRLLESWQIKALAVGSAGLSLWLLSQLYARSPQITPVMTANAGLIVAAVSFLGICTFLQISISSARLLLVGPEALKRVQPYAPPAIAANFSILGLRVGNLLPVPAGTLTNQDLPVPDLPEPDRSGQNLPNSQFNNREKAATLEVTLPMDDESSQSPSDATADPILGSQADGPLKAANPDDIDPNGIDPNSSESVTINSDGTEPDNTDLDSIEPDNIESKSSDDI